MTMAALTLPRAFAVRFKDAHVWSVGSFVRVEWSWPEEYIKPLSKALHRRVEEVDRKQHSIEDLQLVTLHFDGTIEPRDLGSQKDFKGRLFFVYTGNIIYSKIDVRNGAIGVVPPQMPRVAASSEYPVYAVAPDVALPSYIQLLFRTSYFRRAINSMISGASGRKRVQPEQIEAIRVPLPPLPIQHAILKRWDKAQKEVAETWFRIEQLENEIPLLVYTELGASPPALNGPTAKYLVQRWKDLDRWSFNYLARARQGLLGFANSKFPIVSLSQCLLDTMNGYCIKPVTGPTPSKMLKLSALTPAGLDLTESKFINVSKHVAEKFSLHKGDLLICRSVGSYEYIAKSALVESDEPSILFSDIIIRARFNSSILPEYVREVIQTPLGRSYFQSSARTAVGMWKIGAEDIRNFPIPLPPLDKQDNIVQQVEGIRLAIAREQEKARCLAAEVQQEVEEMILGTRPVPEFEGLQKGTA
jgi:type I restriction enzyme S subunit